MKLTWDELMEKLTTENLVNMPYDEVADLYNQTATWGNNKPVRSVRLSDDEAGFEEEDDRPKRKKVAMNPKTGKCWNSVGGFCEDELKNATAVADDVTADDFAKIYRCPVMVFTWVDDDYTYIPGSNFGDWKNVDHANCKDGEGY